MDFSGSEILHSRWFLAGILLMVIIPVVVVIFNEIIHRLKKNYRELTPPINVFKNFILPLITLSIVLTQVLDFSRASTVMKILETFIWILVINALLAMINTLFLSGGEGSLIKTRIPQLFLDIFRVIMVLFGAAIVLSTVWGTDLGGLVTALGLGSFVIGLALQDTLGNLFSGIALVYEKPFQEGDYIQVEDYEGKVIEMNWRAIRLETRNKDLIVIPHLVIGQGALKNLSKPTRVHIMRTELGFGYEVSPNKVKEAIVSTCLATPGILHEPAPEVKTSDFGDYKIVYEIEFAIGDYEFHEEIMDAFKSRVWYTARRFGLTMPFPQQTVRTFQVPYTMEPDSGDRLDAALEQLPNMLPIEQGNIGLLRNGSKEEEFGKGEIIIRQGDPTGYLYIIMDGNVDVRTTNDAGEQLHISMLGKGDFFGEIALFSARKSAFTVEAVEDVKCITIFPDEVLELVEKNPRLAVYLDEMMDARRHKKQELERQ